MSNVPDGRAKPAERALAFALAEFPLLRSFAPRDLRLFARAFGGGGSTHPALLKDDWFLHRGETFTDDPGVPDGFFAAGIASEEGSEFLVAMWRRGSDRFWFQDPYAKGPGAPAVSIGDTRRRFDRAVSGWRARAARSAGS